MDGTPYNMDILREALDYAYGQRDPYEYKEAFDRFKGLLPIFQESISMINRAVLVPNEETDKVSSTWT